MSDIEPGALVESETATIVGLGVPAASFSVAGGAASVDGGGYVTSGFISNGQAVRLRLTAGLHGESRTAMLTVGGLSAGFTATTRALDVAPDPFSIPGLSGQPAGAPVQSAWIRPTGFLDTSPVSVAGGEVRIEGDTEWRTSAVLEPGQRFRVRLTSGAPGETVSAVVDIGGVEATFSVASGS
jgi:hypothetical protein